MLSAMQLLKDQVAVVTGASRGIGQAIAVGLAGAGARVVVVSSKDEVGCRETVEQITGAGGEATYLLTDVSTSAGASAMLNAALEHFGRLDVLVNNAGIQIREPFLEAAENSWDRVMTTNAKSVFLCSQAAARDMIQREIRGRIVNMASHAGYYIHIPGIGPPYHASKAAIIGLTRYMAVELAPYSIRVNAIAPGAVATERVRAALADPTKREQLIRRIPLGRVGEPADIVGCALFLGSTLSDWMTGDTLVIDGGATLW